ncbi:hypothetical protein A2574_00805 [Candidatus Shapirobacteria bacterium RIFOXYD1_FULL_38_32]|uniref:Uncharacterized protein n=2 Tax=Candidatus Shapironibacteriota TaxID=1752721 RepID=A0A0G0JRM9_9BACT|nr:MAG: hypothetical protein US90_C0017G0011 [Candidatus Shapirobacteria bacterium GW2011_GWE2_38_30]KKQ89439.1 MAG: hypothetical protein UT14_C0058G0002 [Candidatus Shapirobacteria bacterium GW2011_GWE1_38_92]OGL56382.1 MAG: hypothetical protein A2195_03285 [Candidatus Shapirobacteria bacterium RIFOXYA1_FULL_39_17]OGL56611.1 MAG: hypothetical protein A2410_01070 [Candidatus Shapirobacteria bacterium RIFOXYC1_FULL_38_24]OGL58001.1 MAG: hypothetical protein A2574_00805 [Candidatus Shapirobacteri
MSFLDKLKDIPGVGTPAPGAGGQREAGPIKQALGDISQDLQVRAGNALIEGYYSVVNPPERKSKVKLSKEEKSERKRKRIDAMRKAGEVGVAGLHLGAGLIKRVVNVARKSDFSVNRLPSGDKEEIIDGEFRDLDETEGGRQNG